MSDKENISYGTFDPKNRISVDAIRAVVTQADERVQQAIGHLNLTREELQKILRTPIEGNDRPVMNDEVGLPQILSSYDITGGQEYLANETAQKIDGELALAQDLHDRGQGKTLTRRESFGELASFGAVTSAACAILFGVWKYKKWKLRQPFPHSSGEATPEHMETGEKRKMTDRQYRDFMTLTEGGTNRLNEIFQGTLIAKSNPDYVQQAVEMSNGDPREDPLVLIEIFLTNKDSIPRATCTREISGGNWTIYYPDISASDKDTLSKRQEFTHSEQCESLEEAAQRLLDVFRI